jgi:putative FmdB family regulatory protein
MPTYDYACEACGHQWELEQRMSEDPVKKCPKCGKLKARRQITGGNFILKGGGWYADLYHKPSGGGGKSSESSSSSSSSSTSSTDSKPSKKD